MQRGPGKSLAHVSRLRDLELSLGSFCCDEEVFWDLHVVGKQHAVSVLGRLEGDPDATTCNSSCEHHQHPVHRTTSVRTQWLRNRRSCGTNRCDLRCDCWSLRGHCVALLSRSGGLSLWLCLRLAHRLRLSRRSRCRAGCWRGACRNRSYRLRLWPGHVALLGSHRFHCGHWCWRCRRHWSRSCSGWRHCGHWCWWNRGHWGCSGRRGCRRGCWGRSDRCATTSARDRTVTLCKRGRGGDDADAGCDGQRQERLLHFSAFVCVNTRKGLIHTVAACQAGPTNAVSATESHQETVMRTFAERRRRSRG